MTCSKHSLKTLNSFGLSINANNVVYATETKMLLDAWQASQQTNQPLLLVGGGSNLLFLSDFLGTVVVNKLKGIEIVETDTDWLIHSAAGENWHEFVQELVSKSVPGLENLALIPGSIGSAPIQNIGAYGVELKDVCEYVDVLDLNSVSVFRLTNEACQFGYRDSIFKHQYQHGYAIVAVGFRLAKKWKPILSYGTLNRLELSSITPQLVFDQVCDIRRSKLPDPTVLGNAGSFFKNPIITAEQAENIRNTYSDIPIYPQPDGRVKVAAGWLIEQAGLKGYSVGQAAVHQHQALVLVNLGTATANDIVSLAKKVRDTVGDKFNIWLEPEVRFIGQFGEVDAVGALS